MAHKEECFAHTAHCQEFESVPDDWSFLRIQYAHQQDGWELDNSGLWFRSDLGRRHEARLHPGSCNTTHQST
jgi:hypothetical protein